MCLKGGSVATPLRATVKRWPGEQLWYWQRSSSLSHWLSRRGRDLRQSGGSTPRAETSSAKSQQWMYAARTPTARRFDHCRRRSSGATAKPQSAQETTARSGTAQKTLERLHTEARSESARSAAHPRVLGCAARYCRVTAGSRSRARASQPSSGGKIACPSVRKCPLALS
jgi:hypothetical protein